MNYQHRHYQHLNVYTLSSTTLPEPLINLPLFAVIIPPLMVILPRLYIVADLDDVPFIFPLLISNSPPARLYIALLNVLLIVPPFTSATP